MALTDAQKRAQSNYMKKFTVARVRIENERYEIIKAHAETTGESINGFINRAITETMDRDKNKGSGE